MAILQLRRRTLIEASGALIVVFGLSGQRSVFGAEAGDEPETLAIDEIDAFLAIDGDGLVTLYSGRIDRNAEARRALRAVVAEDLDVEPERVRLAEGDSGLMAEELAVDRDLSLATGGTQLRQAAATLRNTLLREAARRLGVASEALRIEAGAVAEDAGRQLTYAELVRGRYMALRLAADAARRTA